MPVARLGYGVGLWGLIVLAALCVPFAASAQNTATVQLQGMKAEEVERRFGQPDQRRASDSARETWTYGKSVLLFRNGVVSAWSDAGELSRLLNLAKVRTTDSRGKQERDLWKNPWTPQEGITEESILDELIDRALSEQRTEKIGSEQQVKKPDPVVH